jgi:hypothetical protein
MKTYCQPTASAVHIELLKIINHILSLNILFNVYDMCTEILGKEAANKLKLIPVSNNTV